MESDEEEKDDSPIQPVSLPKPEQPIKEGKEVQQNKKGTPAAKAPAAKVQTAKTPIAKAPATNVQTAKTPIAKAPATNVQTSKTPIAKAPTAKAPTAKVPAAKQTKQAPANETKKTGNAKSANPYMKNIERNKLNHNRRVRSDKKRGLI